MELADAQLDHRHVALKHRLLVIVAVLAFAGWGLVSLRHLDIDAFPDTTPVQVQINTVAPALGPEEIEQRITFPIEQVIGGLAEIAIAPFDFEIRSVAGGRHLRGRHRHLLRPPAYQ